MYIFGVWFEKLPADFPIYDYEIDNMKTRIMRTFSLQYAQNNFSRRVKCKNLIWLLETGKRLMLARLSMKPVDISGFRSASGTGTDHKPLLTLIPRCRG